MKGWRFYEDYRTPKRKVSTGNVVAVATNQRPFPILSYGSVGVAHGVEYQYACVAAVFFDPNSPVCSCSIAMKSLRLFYKRISEAKAREIHPKLFEYLEGEQ